MALRESASNPQYPIASVDNALRLLVLLRDHEELRLSTAARELGVANSTAHRLLAMLQHHGFVQQDPATKAYRVGPTLIEIGLHAVQTLDLREAAHAALGTLAATLQETVHLTVLDHADVRYLDAVDSPRTLRVAVRTGQTRPAHTTASGKALLAALDPDGLRELYPAQTLPAAERRALERELDVVRDRGYAVNVNRDEGLVSVAVPVRSRDGVVVAAVTCAAPIDRMPEERHDAVAETLREGAERISAMVLS